MKNKIFLGLVAIIVVVGIIMVAIRGFNVDVSYKSYNLVDVKIGKDFNISDIKNITNEVFPNKNIEIQKAGVFSDNLVIKVDEISDEQKELLNSKINEKYGIEKKVEDIEVNYIPNFRLRDIVKPYIVPLAVSTVVIFVYMAVRFRKIGIVKVLGQTVLLAIIAEILFAAVIAITRYPVNRLVMPVAIVIYITIITVLTGMFEKQISSEKEKIKSDN